MLKWYFLLIVTKLLCSIVQTKSNYSVTVDGPGLYPDKVVMPARYFFIHFDIATTKLKHSEIENNLEVDIVGKAYSGGRCRVWINKLNRKDGTFIVRYKNYETCYDFKIGILVHGQHVGDSPYHFTGEVLADQCYCPQQNVEEWLKQYGCTGDYSNIYKYLEPFQMVDMNVAVKHIIEKYHRPDSTSFCHYAVKNNKIFRVCYGKHVGFNMFSDNILLFLARKVRLPDMELVINLGDWPLVRKGGEILPVFSWCGSHDNIDVVMPTYDITESTLENMGRVTLDTLSVQGSIDHDWSERKPKAFWRGRDSREDRLKLIDIARRHPDLFNASLTNFFFFRDKEEIYGPKQPHISFFKFFEYKYQINIDGTVAAYRLPYLLAGGGLVLKQQSSYFEHFYSELREWQHYIPVKRDLSDLVKQVKWARDNDEKAHAISKNAQTFANNYLLPQHIICYHATLFKEWSQRINSTVKVRSEMVNVPQLDHNCKCKYNEKNIKEEL